ncbi:hypothetical protein CW705_02465 [Candidatus Bathyarchaeota archaeon]|nr:MAG: hypothetical protein CW705_02465 [Candidatus Bathyarchaeota archaeon]
MKPLDIIYIVKAMLGALTALICLLLRVEDIITAVGIAMLVYLSSDRILKQIFIEKVEKSVVTKTGIGIFIITWLFLWILLYTFMKSFLI